jgi:hypothetical protein
VAWKESSRRLDAENLEHCRNAAEAIALRSRMRRIHSDFRTQPPKTPNDAAARLGPWKDCGPSSPQATNKSSSFRWTYHGPDAGTYGYTGRVGVELWVKKDSVPCDPNQATVDWDVYGDGESNEDLNDKYDCK